MLFKKTQLLVFLFSIIFSSFTFSQTTCYDTSWDKAVDFDGANQNLKQVSSATNVNALRMGGTTYSPPANADNSETTNSTEARPWATTIVFKADGNNSNQYIWNQGEGTGTNADNIYLRLTAAGSLMFGWGREGDGYNEVRIANQNISSSNWYGVYIAHKGYRPSSGAAASATNLTFAFDIRIMSSADSFTATGTNLSAVSSNWISSGIPMNRAVTGDFTIGGIGAERSFHGKVASMVVTTLKVNQVMPSDSEIKLMITDPEKWLADYKVGNAYRPCTSDTNGTFAMNSLASSGATQVWLMGDGTSDSYSNGIRNEVNPTEQNIAKLQLDNNMQNSIQSVNISGFSEAACRATSAIFGTETASTLNLESFTAPSGGADGYAIYINDSNSFTAPSNGDEPTADLSWNGSGQQPVYFGTSASPDITVTDLDPGTTYYFQVYAYNDSSGTETYETTGLNASDATTADTTPPTAPTAGPASADTVTGTAEAGSTVTVYASNGSTVLGTATADSDGNYSVTLSPEQSNGSTLTVTATDASGNESEATTTRVVIGITFEGPSANQTGSNVMDQYDHGWISLDEQLSAGERLVLDNAFFTDFFAEVGGASTIFAIGLKGSNWSNTKQVSNNSSAASDLTFAGNTYIVGVYDNGGNSVWLYPFANGTVGNTMLLNTTALMNTACAFLEVTNSGNNIRLAFGRNGNFINTGDESTVTYGNWNSYKGQTGEQGYGITSLDVVMSFWTFNGGDIDGAEIDWTGLSEVSVPATADASAPDAPTVSTASADTVTGTAETGSTVTVTDSNGDEIGTATANSDGNYSVTLSPAQSDGSTLTVTATDASGNESEETTTTVDALAPTAPTVSTASADTVTGTAEAGSTVTVTDSNGDEIGTDTADSDGNYSVTLSPAQSDGSTLTVTATDASGNESEETTTTADASTVADVAVLMFPQASVAFTLIEAA